MTHPRYYLDVDKLRQVYEFSQFDISDVQRSLVKKMPVHILPPMMEPANVDPRSADLNFLFDFFFPWYGASHNASGFESSWKRREIAISVYDVYFDLRSEHELLHDKGVMMRGIHARLCSKSGCTGLCSGDYRVFYDRVAALVHTFAECLQVESVRHRERMVRQAAEDLNIASTHDLADLNTMFRPLSTTHLRNQPPPPSPKPDQAASPYWWPEPEHVSPMHCGAGTPVIVIEDEESHHVEDGDLEIISVKY